MLLFDYAKIDIIISLSSLVNLFSQITHHFYATP